MLGNLALMWVTTSFRTLSFAELQQALAIGPEDTELDTNAYTKEERLLSTMCGPLVIEAASAQSADS